MVMPIGYDKQDTMFQTAPFNITSYVDGCKACFGVAPKPHWITTYFGTQVDLNEFYSHIMNNQAYHTIHFISLLNYLLREKNSIVWWIYTYCRMSS